MSIATRDEASSQLQARDELAAIELVHVTDEGERDGVCTIYHPDEIEEADGCWLESDCYFGSEVVR